MPSPKVTRAFAQPVEDPRAARLLEIVQHTVAQVRSTEGGTQVTLESALDRDLGLDSLSRVELFARVEQEFAVQLPESVLLSAITPQDLLSALNVAKPPSLAMRRTVASISSDSREVHACPPQTETLVDALSWHVRQHPLGVPITLCGEGNDEPITYEHWWRKALQVAGGLQHRGVNSGDTVALMLPTCADYFYAFFGVLIAGGIPVPIYPPARPTQIEEHIRRHAGILENARSSMLITVPEARGLARLLKAHAPVLREVQTVAGLCSLNVMAKPIAVQGDALAFLQYTSGSTGQPKGVMLSHANVLANIRAVGRAAQVRSDDVFVSWLPLYHDMGLIGACLGTLYFGIPLILMSPVSFLARPARWLWAVHQRRGTLSAAPNFAYEMCATRIRDEEIVGLDLSCWRIAFNGAEAVMPATLRRFQERFGPYGFKSSAMMPVYGLAESSVGLTFPPLGREPRVDHIERTTFMHTHRAYAVSQDEKSAVQFVSCGIPLHSHEIRVVDESNREVEDRVEGRLEFRGPSATHGYYRNCSATEALIHEGWLNTGDRAYLADGELYLTGRVKDIIIRAGRHIYPDEAESAIGEVTGVRKGCVAAFGSRDPQSGTERLVIMAESRSFDTSERMLVRDAIIKRVVSLLGEPPDVVIVVPPHSVLKTSSGKIRRAACRELYEAGRGEVQASSPFRQLLHLRRTSFQAEWFRLKRRVGELLYGSCFWIAFAGVAVVGWLPTVLSSRPERAWHINHVLMHAFLRLARIPLAIVGAEKLPTEGPCVIAANHASYIDGLVLIAALPRRFCFVAKRELLSNLFARLYLTRLDTVFVERLDTKGSVKAASDLEEAARSGRSFLMFPEGTFTHMSGLMPFHLGAFTMAIEAKLPTVPIAIRGTRSLLRDGQWLPKRGPVVVTIGDPIAPAVSDNHFAAALTIRDAARAHILCHCGEPDLAH